MKPQETSQTSMQSVQNSGRSKKRKSVSEWKEIATERAKMIRRLESKINSLNQRLLLATTVNQAKNKYLIECQLLDDFWQWTQKEDLYYEESNQDLG